MKHEFLRHLPTTPNKLRSQGIEIPDEVLAGISPYWTEHINRFGIFQLEMEKKVAEIEYDLVAEGVPVEI